MKNNRKISHSSVDVAEIPAYDAFCGPDHQKEPYEWQCWGLVIRHLRDYSGMDQATFGQLLRGYNRMQISRYETESAEPPIDFWVKMMRIFGLNITWAFTGKGRPYVKEYCDSDERQRLFKWTTLLSEKKEFLTELRGYEAK